MKNIHNIITLLLLLIPLHASPQQDKALGMLDGALGFLLEQDNGAIYFRSIAYGLDNPAEVFSLPAYKEKMGGYWIFDGDKFELSIGDTKGLCNGSIFTIINEAEGLMYIDSVRPENPGDTAAGMPALMQHLNDEFGEHALKYAGEETMNGVLCHKVKVTYKESDTHVLYWINKATGKLYLMAEFQQGAYTVYVVRKTGNAPANHDYTINIPDRELHEYLGYTVMDMRFYKFD